MSKYDVNAGLQLTRSMMFVPAANASMLSTAMVYGADRYMFDLEDAVSPREKDSARLMAFHAIRSPLWSDHDIVVRVNGIDTPWYDDDIDAMVRAGAAVIRLPMVEDAGMIERLDARLTQAEKACGREVGSTKCMAAIESASGVINAVSIASASPRMVAIALAAFDYLMDMHAQRTVDLGLLFYARCSVLHAARYAHLAAYDTVWANVDDEAGFISEAVRGKHLGFDGKSLVNPRQIPVLHAIYTPTQAEVEHAQRVVSAAEEALERGIGVITVDGAMVDGPIIDSARRVLAYSAHTGMRK